MSELEPLDDDILALVKGAKHVPELDPAQKASILAVTVAKIGAPGGGGGGGSDGGAGAGGLGKLGKLGAAIGLFVGGIGVGVVIDRAMIGDGAHAQSAPVAVTTPARLVAGTSTGASPLEAVSALSLPDAPRGSGSAAIHLAGSATARGNASAEAPSSRGLAAERALLDVARSALARGEAGEALVATERHAHEYPDGALVEEREAIAIKALVALGRMDEARSRARVHEQRFPNGLTVRAVKAAVGEAP
ncbi:MAG: hypothetical protein QOI41_5280 [Myxococcales bacterium]|jgi:hypothetical protein|nr:hypothetical protein [Myxococcales bacterium]